MIKSSKILRPITAIILASFILQDVVLANPDILSGPARTATLQTQSVFNSIDPELRLRAIMTMHIEVVARSVKNLDSFRLPLAIRLDPPDGDIKLEINFTRDERSAGGNRVIPCAITDASTGARFECHYEMVRESDGKVSPSLKGWEAAAESEASQEPEFLSEDADETLLRLMDIVSPADTTRQIAPKRRRLLECTPRTRREYNVAGSFGFTDAVAPGELAAAVKKGVVFARELKVEGDKIPRRRYVFEVELTEPVILNDGREVKTLTFESFDSSAATAFFGTFDNSANRNVNTDEMARLIAKPYVVVALGLPMVIATENSMERLAISLGEPIGKLKALFMTAEEARMAAAESARIKDIKKREDAETEARDDLLTMINALCTGDAPRFEEALKEINRYTGRYQNEIAAKKEKVALMLAEQQLGAGRHREALGTVTSYFGQKPNDARAAALIERIEQAVREAQERKSGERIGEIDGVIERAQGLIAEEEWDEAWITVREARKSGLVDGRFGALEDAIRSGAAASIPEWIPPEQADEIRAFLVPYNELQGKLKGAQASRDKIKGQGTQKVKKNLSNSEWRECMNTYPKIADLMRRLPERAFGEVSIQAETVMLLHTSGKMLGFPRTMAELEEAAKLAYREFEMDRGGRLLDPAERDRIMYAGACTKAYCRALEVIYEDPYTVPPRERRLELATTKLRFAIKSYRSNASSDGAEAIMHDGFREWLNTEEIPLIYMRLMPAKSNPSLKYLKILLGLGMSPVVTCEGLSQSLDDSRIYRKDLLMDPEGNAFIRVFMKDHFYDGAYNITGIDVYPVSGETGVGMAEAKALMDDWPKLLEDLKSSSWDGASRRFIVDGITYDFMSLEGVRKLVDTVYPGEAVLSAAAKRDLAERRHKDEAARRGIYGKEFDDRPSPAALRLQGIINYLNRLDIDAPPDAAAMAAARNFLTVFFDEDGDDVVRKVWADFAIRRRLYVDINRFCKMRDADTMTVEEYKEVRSLCAFCADVLEEWREREVEKKGWYLQDIIQTTDVLKSCEYKGADFYFDLELKEISYRMNAISMGDDVEYFQQAGARIVRQARGILDSITLSAGELMYKDDAERLEYLERKMVETEGTYAYCKKYFKAASGRAHEAIALARESVDNAVENRGADEKEFINEMSVRLKGIIEAGCKIKPAVYTVSAPWSTLTAWSIRRAPKREVPSERPWRARLWHGFLRLLVTYWSLSGTQETRDSLLVCEAGKEKDFFDMGDPANLVALERMGYKPHIADSALRELLAIDEAFSSVTVDSSCDYPVFVFTLNRSDGWYIALHKYASEDTAQYDSTDVVERGQLRIFLFEDDMPVSDPARYMDCIGPDGKLKRDSPNGAPRLAEMFKKDGAVRPVFVHTLRGKGITLDALEKLGAKIDGGARAVHAELLSNMKKNLKLETTNLGFIVPRAAVWKARKLEEAGRPDDAVDYLESVLRIYDRSRCRRPEELTRERDRIGAVLIERERAEARLQGRDKALAFIAVFNGAGYGKVEADNEAIDRAIELLSYQMDRGAIRLMHPFLALFFARGPDGRQLVDDKDVKPLIGRAMERGSGALKGLRAWLPEDILDDELANLSAIFSYDLFDVAASGTDYEARAVGCRKAMLDDVSKVPGVDTKSMSLYFGLNGKGIEDLEKDATNLIASHEEHDTLFWEYFKEPQENKVSQEMQSELKILSKLTFELVDITFLKSGIMRNTGRMRLRAGMTAAKTDEYVMTLIGAVRWHREKKEMILQRKADTIEEEKWYEGAIRARTLFENGSFGKALMEVGSIIAKYKETLDEATLNEIDEKGREADGMFRRLKDFEDLVLKAIAAKREKAASAATSPDAPAKKTRQDEARRLLGEVKKDVALQRSRLVKQFLTEIAEGGDFKAAKIGGLRTSIGNERGEISSDDAAAGRLNFYDDVSRLLDSYVAGDADTKKEPGGGPGGGTILEAYDQLLTEAWKAFVSGDVDASRALVRKAIRGYQGIMDINKGSTEGTLGRQQCEYAKTKLSEAEEILERAKVYKAYTEHLLPQKALKLALATRPRERYACFMDYLDTGENQAYAAALTANEDELPDIEEKATGDAEGKKRLPDARRCLTKREFERQWKMASQAELATGALLGWLYITHPTDERLKCIIRLWRDDKRVLDGLAKAMLTRRLTKIRLFKPVKKSDMANIYTTSADVRAALFERLRAMAKKDEDARYFYDALAEKLKDMVNSSSRGKADLLTPSEIIRTFPDDGLIAEILDMWDRVIFGSTISMKLKTGGAVKFADGRDVAAQVDRNRFVRVTSFGSLERFCAVLRDYEKRVAKSDRLHAGMAGSFAGVIEDSIWQRIERYMDSERFASAVYLYATFPSERGFKAIMDHVMTGRRIARDVMRITSEYEDDIMGAAREVRDKVFASRMAGFVNNTTALREAVAAAMDKIKTEEPLKKSIRRSGGRRGNGKGRERSQLSIALSELVTKPADFDWEAHKDELPDIKGLKIEKVSIIGTIGITPYRGYAFQWCVMGQNSGGWSGVITRCGVVNGVYEFDLELSKEGEQPISKTYQIGRITRTAYLNRKLTAEEIAQGIAPQEKTYLVISERLGIEGLVEMMRKPADFDWQANRRLITDLKGLSVGKTNKEGSISFGVLPGQVMEWRAIKGVKDKKGWRGVITRSGVVNGLFELEVEFTKEGERPIFSQVLQIGRVKNIKSKGNKDGFLTMSDGLGLIAISRIIGEGAGKDIKSGWWTRNKDIPDIRWMRLGATDENGRFIVKMDGEFKNFSFPWQTGVKEGGWSGIITESSVCERGLEFTVLFTKEQRKAFKQRFRIGVDARLMDGSYSSKGKTLSVPDIVAISGPPVGAGEDEASEKQAMDLKDPAKAAAQIAGSLCSMMKKKRVVLAFDSSLGGADGGRALAVFDVIKELKKDSNYAKLLENVEVIKAEPGRLAKRIEDCDAKNSEIFVFLREGAARKHPNLMSGKAANVHASFIDETELVPGAYYPIFEIVAVALARYVYDIPIDKIRKVLDAADLDMLGNITGRALVFRLLPPTRRYSTKELIQRYANLKECLRAA